MYLSKLTLDARHPQAQTDLTAPYELHRTLAQAFPDAESDRHRARHGVLFRIEEAGRGGGAVLVQSTTAPDWGRLPPGYAHHADGPKPFALALAAGQRLRFRLVANPVRRERIDGKPQPRRAALVHPRTKDGVEAGYLDWLDRQAAASGFAVEGVADVPFHLASKRRAGTDEIAKGRIPHFGVRFDGLLTVIDPVALGSALRGGIGPAKAFGFGLLSLAPV
jgi:CRISPR system Cascade subunit CasE